jgi:hypothetical protein
MKLKTLLTVYSAAAMIICLNFLLVPGFWITLYGASVDSQAAFLYRLIAALFGGLAVMAWLGRSAEPSPSRDAMVRGLLAVNGLAALVAVLGAATGVYNRFAWGPVGMFAVFAVGFALATPTGVLARASSRELSWVSSEPESSRGLQKKLWWMR